MRKGGSNSVSVSEWDIVKGIGIFGLPFVHTVETFLLCELIDPNEQLLCDAIIALTIFGPSIFMINMGMSLTKQQSAKALLRYGRILFFIGILLNILRSIIPAILVVAVTGSTADHLVSFVFMSDIYLFTGLFYMILGLFRSKSISTRGIAIIAVFMLIINTLFGGVLRTGSETVNAILGNLVYIDDGSVFPLLSWSVFPAFGMLVGELFYKKSEDEVDRLYNKAFIVSSVILVSISVGMYLMKMDPLLVAASPLNDSKTDVLNVILVLCLNVIAVSLIRFISSKIEFAKLGKFLNWLSANLMIFYFLHWCILTLICYAVASILTVNGLTAGFGLMMAIAVIVEILTIVVVKKYGFRMMVFILKIVKA